MAGWCVPLLDAVSGTQAGPYQHSVCVSTSMRLCVRACVCVCACLFCAAARRLCATLLWRQKEKARSACLLACLSACLPGWEVCGQTSEN